MIGSRLIAGDSAPHPYTQSDTRAKTQPRRNYLWASGDTYKTDPRTRDRAGPGMWKAMCVPGPPSTITDCATGVSGGTAPSARAAATASRPRTWCGRPATRCSTSSVSPAWSAENSCQPGRSCTCWTRTGSSVKKITSAARVCRVSSARDVTASVVTGRL